MSTMLERLAGHVARPTAEIDRLAAERHLLDWLACVAGARQSAVVAAARSLGDPLASAALAGNVLEMDDVHRLARLHPGPVIWPAVLELADDREVMVDGAIGGYEAMIAIGETLDSQAYAHWHPTAVAGLAGATAAAARVLGLTPDKTADALGHAVSLAGGLWHMRHGNSMTKQVHVLHAAEAGVRLARLAGAGLTGAAGSLEGPQGLHEAMCDVSSPVVLGPAWRLHEVSFKPWAACRHVHPAIDAALALPEEPGGVLVETYGDALAFCDRPDPQTPAEARFSIQHGVAAAIAFGEVGPEHFEAPAIAQLAPLREAVRVVEDPAITALYPAHFGARLTAGGVRIERLDTLGDPERPMSEAQHRGKLETLCAWGGLDRAAPEAAEVAVRSSPQAVSALLAEWLG
jgi:2-methylcitrate dehydratase PrpD